MSHLAHLSGIAADAQIQLWLAVGLEEAVHRVYSLPSALVSLKLSVITGPSAIAFAVPRDPDSLGHASLARPTPTPPALDTRQDTARQSGPAGMPRTLRNLLGALQPRRRLQEAMARIEALSEERSRLLRQCLLLADTVRDSENGRAKVEARLFAIRAEERQRIAQDLHDQAGHEMTAAIAALRLLRDRARGPNRRHLEEIAQRLCEVGRRLHHAVIGECPRIVEERGLRDALDATVAAYAADAGLRRSFVVTGFREGRLSRAAETAIYRVAQEAMNNVVKHACASRLKVRLIMTVSSVSLIVSDDGIGFGTPLSQDDRVETVGIGGMMRRMTEIGGTLQIDTTPGVGTTVCVKLPIDTAMREVPER